jgi:hypothetical protein
MSLPCAIRRDAMTPQRELLASALDLPSRWWGF